MSPPSGPRPFAPVRLIVFLSEAMLACEKAVVGGLMMLILALILLNVGTRYAGIPLYWVDEAAVYAMVWLAFIGASALTRLRLDFSVTLLSDKLSEKNARRMKAFASLFGAVFAFALAVMCWRWMDPIGIAAAGFDAKAYAGQTFNFLYTEQTQTLRWPTWAISMVIPIFAATMLLHTLANFFEDLGFSPPRAHPGFSNTEGVN
ncbi:TRAP transporter small permease [Phyllobacterium leguminum]|uniref:TRAP transporter small permease protein n=1 Tax=Phyllobacterium leguminum TaxID=314237 RepID=A0A318SZN5_9HYPH|nr:TRAP transporter small permease [Phyllobacterium leguminum]PYE85257.1 TRAP-type C4-dicarboxylate transport system permease small subunit [Phyllobacterium leguminum]